MRILEPSVFLTFMIKKCLTFFGGGIIEDIHILGAFMKKFIHYVIFVCLCFLIIPVFARNSEHEKNLLDFNVQGIKLGSKLSDFKLKFPDATIDQEVSRESIGDVTYSVSDIPNIDLCIFSFYSGKLYKIGIGYTASQANKLGGWENIVMNLVERYGKFDENTTDEDDVFSAYLKNNAIARYLAVRVSSEFMMIKVIERNIEGELNAKKRETMDLGF